MLAYRCYYDGTIYYNLTICTKKSFMRDLGLLMYFEKMAELYRKLKAGEQVEGLKYDFSKAVPHYLMYTTTGRADLIMFESSFQKRKKRV